MRQPFVPAQAGTQGANLRVLIVALGSRLRGNERSLFEPLRISL